MIILGLLIVAGVTIIGITITTRLNDMSQNDIAVDMPDVGLGINGVTSGGDVQPHMGYYVILLNTLAFTIGNTKVRLGQKESLFGR